MVVSMRMLVSREVGPEATRARPPESGLRCGPQWAGPYWPAMLSRSWRCTWAVGFIVAPAARRLPYWPAILRYICRSTWVEGLTTAGAADWLPYWPATLSRSSLRVWALGLTTARGAG